jgi:hypothetical protein
MELSLPITTNYEYLLILVIPTIHEKKLKLNVEIEIIEDISQRKQYEKKSHKERLIKLQKNLIICR